MAEKIMKKEDEIAKLKAELKQEEEILAILVGQRNKSMNDCRKQEKKVAQLREDMLKEILG